MMIVLSFRCWDVPLKVGTRKSEATRERVENHFQGTRNATNNQQLRLGLEARNIL